MQEYFTKILNQIVAAIPNFLSAVLIFIVSLYLASLISKLLRRAFEKRNTSPGVTNLALAVCTLAHYRFWRDRIPSTFL